jgi:hypothetical protein
MLATFGQSLQIGQHCSQSMSSWANVAQNFIIPASGQAVIPSSFQVSELEVWEIEDLESGVDSDLHPPLCATAAAPAAAPAARLQARSRRGRRQL